MTEGKRDRDRENERERMKEILREREWERGGLTDSTVFFHLLSYKFNT